jgi:seryl-tRNA synthetase
MCDATTKSTAADLLIPTAEPGIYLRSEVFQLAVEALRRGFFALPNEQGAVGFHSPGMIPRQDLIRSSYLDRFPQFAARISPELHDAGSDPLMTLPSACLSIYGAVAAMEAAPAEGRLVAVSAPCFRNEVHYSPVRMRSFNMSEYVFFGDEAQVKTFREDMIHRVQAWLLTLGLAPRLAQANDPFFGRIADILAERQRAANLKLELLLPTGADEEVACFSFNDHRDFFCLRWDIRGDHGRDLQSACVGVGLERLALAMFHRHGPDLAAWPTPARS